MEGLSTMYGSVFFFGPVLTTLLIGITSILLIYWYSVRNYGYWKKRGIPTPKTVPFLGTFMDSFSKGMYEVELERYKKFGRLYGHYEMNMPVISIADPVLLKDILVKDFNFFPNRRVFDSGDKVFDLSLSQLLGDEWKRVRNIVTPTFTTGKIKRMLSIFKDCSNTLIQNFKNASGRPIDVKGLYGAFTMDIIASSAFSTKIDSHNDPENEFAKAAKDVFTTPFSWKLIFFLLMPRLWILLGNSIFPKTSMNFFKNVTRQIIEERRKTGQVRNDFLQLLLDTTKEESQEKKWSTPEKDNEDIASNYGEEGQLVFKNVSTKQLNMDELISQCAMFFLAGYDTTATTLSTASFYLAINPEIQDKLRAEVDEAVKETNGELTYESIQGMKYLDNVISETLRLCPPAVRLDRTAVVDYNLGNTGITIPKGMVVTIPTYAIHRDPEFFTDPEKFDPDRFTLEERMKREQYTYLPFGAGPRNCVGMRFVLTEMKVCLATIIANFVIKRCPETKVPMEFIRSPGLLSPKEILLKMEVRTDSPLQS